MAKQIAGCEPGQESERLPPTGTYTHPPHTLPTGYAQDEPILLIVFKKVIKSYQQAVAVRPAVMLS
jgi:hypothetical protein